MNSPEISPQLAVAGLWVRLASIVGLAAYLLLKGGADGYTLADVLASAALVALWTPLMASYLRGEGLLPTDARRVWLTRLYPWLVAYEAALWSLSALVLLSGQFPNADPAAILIYVLLGGASVAMNFLIFAVSLRLMLHPEDQTGRNGFAELLNWAAAVSAANLVTALIGLNGLPAQSTAERWAFGLQGAVEVAALLLLRWALRVSVTKHQD